MIDFLNERIRLYDLVKEGIDVHPSYPELEQFEQLAIQISPNRDFPWRGCQDCVNYLVKFVFDNQSKLDEKGKA